MIRQVFRYSRPNILGTDAVDAYFILLQRNLARRCSVGSMLRKALRFGLLAPLVQ